MIDIEEQVRVYAQAITNDDLTAPSSSGLEPYDGRDGAFGAPGRGRFLAAAAIVLLILASGVLIARGDGEGEPTLDEATTTTEDHVDQDRVETSPTTGTSIEASVETSTTVTEVESGPPLLGDGVIVPTTNTTIEPSPEPVPALPPGPLADPETTTYVVSAPSEVAAGESFVLSVVVTNTSGAPAYLPDVVTADGCRPFSPVLNGQDVGDQSQYECNSWTELPVGTSTWTQIVETSEVTCRVVGDMALVDRSTPGAICLPRSDAPPLPVGENQVWVWSGPGLTSSITILPPAFVAVTLT